MMIFCLCKDIFSLGNNKNRRCNTKKKLLQLYYNLRALCGQASAWCRPAVAGRQLRRTILKKVFHILGKVLLTAVVLLYVAVALLNYSVVQSLAGHLVGKVLSEEWGGKVQVGSMNVNLFNSVRLRDVQLITPAGDTVADMRRLVVRYDEMPLQADGLHLKSVFIGPTYFHLHDKDDKLTLLQFVHFLSDKFASDEEEEEDDTPREHPFMVHIETVMARNIHYKQTLKVPDGSHSPTGIDVPDMEFFDINFKFRNVRVEPSPRVTLRMERFSAREASGLRVNRLSMNTYVGFDGICATGMELETDHSRIYADVLMSYDRFPSFKHFFDSVRFDVTFHKGTRCCMKDASYWTHALWGMDEPIALEGVVYGPLGDMTVEQMQVVLGEHTSLRFDGYMRGLPEIDHTRFGINLHQLTTHYDDLAAIRWSETVQVPFPAFLGSLGHIAATAQFDGTIRDFAAQLDATTEAGPLAVQGTLQYDTLARDYRYRATAQSAALQVSALAANEWVSSSGVELAVSGRGFDPSAMTATVEGTLRNTMVRGVAIADTKLSLEADEGRWQGVASVSDGAADIDLSLSADLRAGRDSLGLQAEVRHLDLAALHLWSRESDSTAVLATRLQAALHGRELEPLSGTVALDSSSLVLNADTLTLCRAVLEVEADDDGKDIVLQSDLADLSMSGHFAYGALPALMQRFVTSYVPAFYTRHLTVDSLALTPTADFHFDMMWLDTLGQLSRFVPSLRVADSTTLFIDYNYNEQMKMLLRSDSIGVGGLTFASVWMNTSGSGDSYAINFDVQSLTGAAGIIMSDISCSTRVAPSRSTAHLWWGKDTTGMFNRGDLALRLASSTDGNNLTIRQGTLELNRERWTVSTAQPIFFDDSSFVAQQLTLRSKGQKVSASASLQHDSNDALQVLFDNFGLQQLNPFLGAMGFTVAGSLNGTMNLRDLYTTPYFSTDLVVNHTEVSGQALGTAGITSEWLPDSRQVRVELTTELPAEQGGTHPVLARGAVDLSQAQQTGLDFDVWLDGFRLQTLQPLVRGALSELQGGLRGHFKVQGTTQQPELTGVGYIDDGAVRVAFTNVRYSFTDSIAFSNDTIRFDHFALRDPNNHVAYVDGVIAHDKLKDFRLHLALDGDNLLVLDNTARQSDYYGTILAAVQGSVRGAVDDLQVRVAARTLRGSSLEIPVSQQRSVQDVDYIQFVLPAGAVRRKETAEKTSQNMVRVEASLQITPDVLLHLPVEIPAVTADIKAKGSGELAVNLTSGSPLSVIGDYEISSGDMGLTFIGLASRNFTIEEGSTINFPGTLSAATFNLHAIYSQRVELGSLVGSTADNAQTMVPVDNVINLVGSLAAPSVSFGLRLPNADQSLQDEVFSYIDTSNAQAIMNQTMSLLITNQFYSAGGGNAPTGGGTSLVVNTLGNVLSDMVEFADININYREATAESAGQVEMGVSHEWDKIYFEGTFGYGGELRSVEDMNGVNNLTGDILIGYKFNPMLHGYVFNRSNTNDYTRSDLPYKQGVGMKFVRDYDQWRYLFRSEQKKLERKQKRQQRREAKEAASAKDIPAPDGSTPAMSDGAAVPATR